jgi:organic hydroperoxide reductase OsmC/OhrA
MQPLPHHYVVTANAEASGSLYLSADGLPDLESAAPAEFDGPGDQWSPESLLCAAVASCFILTFRSVARAAQLEWQDLECNVEGMLERVNGVTQFTRLVTKVTLTVDSSVDASLCWRTVERAERSCLVANSLNAKRDLRAEIQTTDSPVAVS